MRGKLIKRQRIFRRIFSAVAAIFPITALLLTACVEGVGSTNVNVVDNDGLTVSFGAGPYIATEGGAPAIVEIRLSNTPANDVEISIETTEENGASASDYSLSTNTIVLPFLPTPAAQP